MIRLRVPEGALHWLAFAYSPINEAIMSLHVLCQPKHHPVQHGWVRQCRTLPPELKRRIRSFEFLYEDYVPSLIASEGQPEFATFDQEIAWLEDLDDRRVAYELTRSLAHEFPRNEEAFDDPKVQAALVERATEHGPDAERKVRAIFEDPRLVLKEVLELLHDYWEQAFEKEWERVETLLADAVVSAGQHLVNHGPYEFLSNLSPRVHADANESSIYINKLDDVDETLRRGAQLVLVPSAYAWPHIGIELDDSLAPSIVYPAPQILELSRPRIPPRDLVSVLRAVADDTRLRALRLIAERPRSTQELAPLVGVSESALSKHLKTLVGAGILSTRRQGYYVLYELSPERLTALSASINAYLEER